MSDRVLSIVEFARPAWLWCLLPLAGWLVLCVRHSLTTLTPRQQRISLMIRAAQWLLLVLALAGFSWRRWADQRYVVVAVDRSASVGQEGRQAADDWLRQCAESRGPHRLAWVEFAQTPGQLRAWTDESSGNVLSNVAFDGGDPAALGTSLGEVLALARASIPLGTQPQVVLLSDGCETQGDVLAGAERLGIPVSTVVLPRSEQPETQVAEVRLPANVRVGEPFDVEATIATNAAGAAELELYRDDFRVSLGDAGKVQLTPGSNTLRLRQQIDAPQTVRYLVRVVAEQDVRLDDNQLSALAVVQGRPRLLLVDQEPETLDSLRWALEDQAMVVDVRPPAGFPNRAVDLLAYDAVALSNVSADQLSAEQLEWLRQYVQQFGGGLLMFGSEKSFGLGGYYRTPLEQVLPVRSDLQQESEKPSLAMMLVVDRSGSMGGLKLELAKDAARAAVELLGARDQIGVVAFDDDAYWVTPLQAATDKAAIMDRISRLGAAGGTNMYPALVEARKALMATAAKLKHVIVLGDGISAPADFPSETSEMVQQRITVSTVALGEKADRDLLRSIADQGGGRYYECEDPRAVPQVFARETILASKSAVEEDPFLPQQIRATSVLRGIDLDTAPLLLGHVVTRPKPTSEVILVTESGAPLLAWWRSGLGMALAWTSDTKSRWAAEWVAWPDFSIFWAQCFRHVMKRQQASNGQVVLEPVGERTRITLDLVDANDRYVNDANVRVAMLGPPEQASSAESSNETTAGQELLMQQVAPGRYAVDVSTAAPGGYYFDVLAAVDRQIVFRQAQGRFVGYPDELRLSPPDRSLMEELAQRTGGLFDAEPAQVWQLQQPRVPRWIEGWPPLVAAALLLLLADVAIRRLDLARNT